MDYSLPRTEEVDKAAARYRARVWNAFVALHTLGDLTIKKTERGGYRLLITRKDESVESFNARTIEGVVELAASVYLIKGVQP